MRKNTVEDAIQTYYETLADAQRSGVEINGRHYQAEEAVRGMYSERVARAAIYVTQGTTEDDLNDWGGP